MNAQLTKPVSLEEFEDTVFSMSPNKPPRHDGDTLFFKNFGTFFFYDLLVAVSSFFHSSHLLTSMNHTVLSLILKIQNPNLVFHYRPISCIILFIRFYLKF
ncbi:hypothetical protein ACH5RR_026509 [Cinchona calisaya]|uniref:Uncharacterized protein n=1 Tax=Cinchona calisaya TaxID=153742 RepID=A0ABD2Z2S3_9GENT